MDKLTIAMKKMTYHLGGVQQFLAGSDSTAQRARSRDRKTKKPVSGILPVVDIEFRGFKDLFLDEY